MSPSITLLPEDEDGTRLYQASISVPGVATFEGTGMDIVDSLIDLCEKLAEEVEDG